MTAEDQAILLRQALKGKKAALKQLFADAEQALAHEDFASAAALFKESAICYRIALFRERAAAEELEQRVSTLETKLAFKTRLLAKPAAYFQIHCPPDADLTFESMARAWHHLTWDEDLAAAALCVVELWHAQGEPFSSPGGSETRRLISSVQGILKQAREQQGTLPHARPSETWLLLTPIVHAMAALLSPRNHGDPNA